MKKICAGAVAAVISVMLAVFMLPVNSEDIKSIAVYGDKPVAVKNDVEVQVAYSAIMYKNKVYVPADDTLKLLDYTLGWDADINSIIALRDGHTNYIVCGMKKGRVWVDENCVEFTTPPVTYKGVTFISLEMIAAMADDSIYILGTPEYIKKDRRDLLESTQISNKYRLSGSVKTYNNVKVIGNTAMEQLSITDKSATAYAEMVNKVADAIPGAQVYCIAVPTASEFYGPEKIYTNQTEGIRKIYKKLSDKVMPVNVVKPLMEHANEFIYFRTDHHWTQRGAYYAYKEFAEIKGLEMPPLSSFQTNNSTTHVGSFAGFMDGTEGENIMRNNPDLLERFMPLYDADGAAYNDQHMKKHRSALEIVFPTFNSYSAFIGGDNPLAVFRTTNANGKKLVVIKESFGTAFSTWAVNHYEYIFVIDPRKFNGFGGREESFNLKSFYERHHFHDLVIINYPGTIGSSSYRESVLDMIK